MGSLIIAHAVPLVGKVYYWRKGTLALRSLQSKADTGILKATDIQKAQEWENEGYNTERLWDMLVMFTSC